MQRRRRGVSVAVVMGGLLVVSLGLLSSAARADTGQLGDDSPQPPPASTPVEAPAAQPPQEDVRPHGGFGVFAGYGNHFGQIHPDVGGSFHYSGAGSAIGIDYEGSERDRISMRVFYEGTNAPLSGDLTPYFDRMSVVELGVEPRYWFDRWYVGGRLGLYSLGFVDHSGRGNDPLIAGDVFLGVAGGFEANSGVFVSSAIDGTTISKVPGETVRQSAGSPPVTISKGTADAFSFWLTVGYRWRGRK